MRRPGKKASALEAPPTGAAAWLIRFFSTAGWAGLVPGIPGTAGSFMGVILWYVIGRVHPRPFTSFLILLGIYFFGVVMAERATRMFPEAEHNVIVIDEMLGFMIAASFVAPGFYVNEDRLILAMFFVYRMFNIMKPFPMKKLESLPGGWGIMSDDLLSGVVTLLVFYLPFQGFWYVQLGLSVAAGS